ncbi:hypothetical protein BH20ACT5_BH20ACT5_10860 [soil metagenome]
MTNPTTNTRPRSTRTAVVGLVLAGLAVLAIIPVRGGEDAGFALVVGPLLLLSAAALWRFGRPAHIWAAVLGLLMTLMFGAYAVVGLTDGGEPGVIVLDVAVTVGAVLTLYGAVTYLAGSRGRSKVTA